MTTSNKATYVTRDAVLKLLTDDEVAKVSTAESASHLKDGDEYLDLEHLDQGVRRAASDKKIAMGPVVSRKAVSAASWGKIMAIIAKKA